MDADKNRFSDERVSWNIVEEIYHSEHIVIDVFSESGEFLEDVRTKAIRIEDYSSEPHKIVIVFPHQKVSDEALIKALNSKEC